jgi:anaerobic C4-dicarboxylate transporter
MKTLLACLFAIVAVYGFIGLAEAGLFESIISQFKSNVSNGAGQIPWTAVLILLATGIIGFLGIRRKGKKS